MRFVEFRELMSKHLAKMFAEHQNLFVVDVNKDLLWETYLESFPPGTNGVFRERREHDCSCCRGFIKAFGGVVGIGVYNSLVSIWDFVVEDTTYGPVAAAMSALVGRGRVVDVFLTSETGFGVEHNFEQGENGDALRWEHFYVVLPKRFCRKKGVVGGLKGEIRNTCGVFKRSLSEISRDSVEAVLDLIAQRSLYKGEEWSAVLESFLGLLVEYEKLPLEAKENYCWRVGVEVGEVLGRIRNHSIGTLLVNIGSGMDLDEAVRRYEVIVAPTNYKRPKAVFTKKMLEEAQKTLSDLGLVGSLGRRFAVMEDITINNVLFANRDSVRRMEGDVFAELAGEAVTAPKRFDRVEEIGVDTFLKDILPRTTDIEVFLENRHFGNLVSVIAPVDKSAPSLFKWSNGFSWAYVGNITDSMKERVKAAGGNVEGVLRFSLQWNEDGKNQDDFDAHCIEPRGNEIYFNRKRSAYGTTGELDVDIIHPGEDQVAVENIVWTDKNKMMEGEYRFFVINYAYRGGVGGFRAEIEFDGQIHQFDYSGPLRQDEKVPVAVVSYTKKKGFEISPVLASSVSSRRMWGLDTNQFHPVSACMFSPNYWDEQVGIGHRHLFFILGGCLNDTLPNGFFNEFLREDLMKHKRVFEALGNKMRVAPSSDQLSGVGFSTTKRDFVVCKLKGHVTRVVKIVF